MIINQVIQTIKTHLQEIKEKFQISEIGILEYDNGEFEIVVDFEAPTGFFEFFRLQDFLCELLGMKIELITKDVAEKYSNKILIVGE